MIPFILGFICGFALAILIFVIFIIARASGLASREEGWDQKDDIHGYAEPTGSDETD